MSHVEVGEAEIHDLDLLKSMCKENGWEFLENKTTFNWFGRHVGDYALPENYSVDDMGKCEHAIKVPGISYEIGVVKSKTTKTGYKLMYDFYGPGRQLIEKLGGKKSEGFMKKYAQKSVYKYAAKNGYSVAKKELESGQVKLTLTSKYD